MNGAQLIAEILKREGTDFLSCYPRNPIIEACAKIDIRPILCRQERVGVGIADGYTRIKRGKKNGVFAAQAGPGIENAFPGIAQAYAENVPMLDHSFSATAVASITYAQTSAPPRSTGRSPNGLLLRTSCAGIAGTDASRLSGHAQWQRRPGPDRGSAGSLGGGISKASRITCRCR